MKRDRLKGGTTCHRVVTGSIIGFNARRSRIDRVSGGKLRSGRLKKSFTNYFGVVHPRIKRVILAALVLFFGLVEAGAAVKTNFRKGEELSNAEVERALRLARKAGVTNVAEVSSYDPEIKVKSPEAIKGREVTFVTVDMHTYAPLVPLISSLTNIVWFEGNFWVAMEDVRTNKLTLFEMKGRQIRVWLAGTISVEEADGVAAKLAAGKVRYSSEESKREARGIDLLKPFEIAKRRDGEEIFIGFSCGEACELTMKCVLDKDGMVVKNVVRMIID